MVFSGFLEGDKGGYEKKKKEQKFFQAKYKSTAITVAAAAVVKA